MPSERVDSLEHHGDPRADTVVRAGHVVNCVSHHTSGHHTSGHQSEFSSAGCLASNVSSNNTINLHPDHTAFKSPSTKQECSKLVQNLSRETAVYCALSMSLGGTCDSYLLRDELAHACNKVFESTMLCKRRLMPLLLSKRLKDEEREDLERLYRIFAGCVEMLQTEFIRAMTLQSLFPLWDPSTQLIQTGISEVFIHRKLCTTLESLDVTDLDRKMKDVEEAINLERKVSTLQELLYSTSQLMDVQPWDYKPDTDHNKIEVETSDIEPEGSDVIDEEAHINTGSPRHRKCIWIMVLTLGIIVVVAGVLGLIFALNKDENST